MHEDTFELSRRSLLGTAALGAASFALPVKAGVGEPLRQQDRRHGAIKQSVAQWCFGSVGWSVADTVRAATSLGCPSVELVDPPDWDLLRDNDLVCAIALNGMPGAPFIKGLNNPAYHEEVIGRTKEMIDACGASDGLCRQVIAFTGYKYRDAEDPTSGEISLDEGEDNCVKGLRALGEYAEPHGVTISIEMLNTRDDTHPMKGHPGYQGDDIDYVADIVKRVDMPNVKILFDVYHVQIMNGDLIRRIRQYRDLISHVHVAGNPGRAELHLSQEIDYASVMTALLDIGYDGYVGQEFIPTADPMEGLRRAVEVCDVEEATERPSD
jgi:hydroxypyruvate isomerase